MVHRAGRAIADGENRIAGGIGQVWKAYNNMFFDLADGCDFRCGIKLNVPPAGSAPAPAESAPAPAASAPAPAALAQGRSLVFADLAMVVQDAEAHKLAFDWNWGICDQMLPTLSQYRE